MFCQTLTTIIGSLGESRKRMSTESTQEEPVRKGVKLGPQETDKTKQIGQEGLPAVENTQHNQSNLGKKVMKSLMSHILPNFLVLIIFFLL